MGFPENLSSLALDRTLSTPLYSQLKDALLLLVQDDQFQEGDPIPTEGEICEQFQVSRITVRRAISELARDGYLMSRQGKGTFVARPKIERPLSKMKSFSVATSDTGHKPGSRLLSLRHERAADSVAAALSIEPDECIWFVERLRLIDEELIGVSMTYLKLAPDLSLSPAELEQETSLWSILEKKGLSLSRAEETIEVAMADERQAALLHVPVGAPLLLVEGTVYNDQAAPVEYHRTFNRGDRYKYKIQTIR